MPSGFQTLGGICGIGGQKTEDNQSLLPGGSQEKLTGNGCATGHYPGGFTNHTSIPLTERQPLGPFLVRFITVSSVGFTSSIGFVYNTDFNIRVRKRKRKPWN